MKRQARIISRQEEKISPWVSLVSKGVSFSQGSPVEDYHAVSQGDYVGILAVDPDGLIPIVQQFRPAIERYTWEFPAGLMDHPGETPAQVCGRELAEETGMKARKIISLASLAADTGRLTNHIHSFFVEASGPEPDFVPEPGTNVRYVAYGDLLDMIRQNEFISQMHVAILFLAHLKAEVRSHLGDPF